ncbi:hypothetical protein [Microbulbifer sp. SSSA005]
MIRKRKELAATTNHLKINRLGKVGGLFEAKKGTVLPSSNVLTS